MTAKFCEKCGSILHVIKKDGKMFLICKHCDFCEETTEGASHKEKRDNKSQEIKAIKAQNIHATFPHTCSKCGYNKAEVIDLGVWYTDEDSVVMFKCGKCGYTEKRGKVQ